MSLTGDPKPSRRRLPRRAALVFTLGCAAFAAPRDALAAPLSRDAQKGLAKAKSGDCVAAVPLLEAAEEKGHRPATAFALAGCEAALGELVLARDMYRSIAGEEPQPGWIAQDKQARAQAGAKADALDARIPTIELHIEGGAPPDMEVRLGDKTIDDIESPIAVPPDEKVDLTISAPGYEDHVEPIVLHEGERRKLDVSLDKKAKPKPPPPPARTEPEWWLGARFRGMLIPTFLMNVVADGGTTVYEPGGGFTVTKMFDHVELVPSLTYTYYGMGPTPFKPHDTPDTEWEIDESNLHSLALSLDILYDVPLDVKGVATFRIGGGIGLGWMFAGDLIRTQAYPADLQPGDPSTYLKCKGPNDPPGSFRYCNALDKDKDRYGQPDKAWGDGGARPIVYPWLALPELGLTFKPVKRFAIDIELGATLSGFLSGVGLRYGL